MDNSTNILPYNNDIYSSLNTISDISVNCPDDLIYSNNISRNELQDILKLKENISNILNNTSDIDDMIYEKYNYKNDEIDNMINKIDELTKDFEKKQSELNIIDNKLSAEIKNMKKKIDQLDAIQVFLDKIDDKEDNNILIKNIKTNISELSKNISNTDIFDKLKFEYIEKRKEIDAYLYYLKKLNKSNISNKCPICLNETINKFLDPCGHTLCNICINKHINRSNNSINEHNNFEYIRNYDIGCPICRTKITNVKSLFIL